MYMSMGSLGAGGAKTGVVAIARLSSLKAASAASLQTNLSVFFSKWYNGRAFSPSRLMNRLRDARQPVNFWMSLTLHGCRMLSMAAIFSGLASIPLAETR